jgi:hypothetical protein
MDRGDKIFLGAVAGVVVGAGVATTRRRRRSEIAELERIDPDLAAAHESQRPQFLDTPCEQCGVNAGFRERQGTRVEPHVIEGGRLTTPVVQDQKVFFTYHACRNCGAAVAA